MAWAALRRPRRPRKTCCPRISERKRGRRCGKRGGRWLFRGHRLFGGLGRSGLLGHLPFARRLASLFGWLLRHLALGRLLLFAGLFGRLFGHLALSGRLASSRPLGGALSCSPLF